MRKTVFWLLAFLSLLSITIFTTVGCRAKEIQEHEHEQEYREITILTLPELGAVILDSAPLQVVATTSVIGDVVAQVGGDAIELTTLIGPGQDPHSYKPAAQDMVTVSQAHVIFVNGWDLEETLIHDLKDIGEDIALVPVSANIEPLAFGEHQEDHGEEETERAQDEEHRHQGADPHTWFSVHNVEQWVENIEHVLSDLDPANAETYAKNATAYLVKLEELEAYVKTQLDSIPAENRFLVTNHDSFGYLAHEYHLDILGTVIPAASTVAEPSASDLAELIQEMEEHDVCTLFTETTVNDKLAQTIATELSGCDQVRVLGLYTGAIGPAGSSADSYIGMLRFNVDTIVKGLN